ncbi:MAG: ABC transporter permease subunit [Gammaproteobacteria bacterium]|nr:ABC transporter permease subunit [Gammaproteobacteria bacterium]
MSGLLVKTNNSIRENLWRYFIVAIPYIWLLLFFLAPFVIVFKISLADPIIAQPPFTPFFNQGSDGGFSIYTTFDNFLYLFQDSLYFVTYLNSVKLAFIATLFTLLIGYPIAYGIARSPQPTRNILLLLVVIPFWISFLLRVYSWMGILKTNGLINGFLLWLGVIDQPLELLYTDTAVYIGMVYSYLPYMILPLYANLVKLDIRLLEAASDLGAKKWQGFVDVTLPLSMPGIIAGCLLVFIPAIGEYVIPALLGGADTLMIGRVLFDEFFLNRDWPVASAVAIVLLLLLVLPIVYFQKKQAQETSGAAA